MNTEPSLHKELAADWNKVVSFIEERFQKKPDLNAVLFLIGIRELGLLPETRFSKEEKTHLMHIANCKILSYSGFYEQVGFDKNGWPVWENRKPLPAMDIFEQEILIRQHIVEYFEREEIF